MPEHYFTAEPTSELKLRSLTFAVPWNRTAISDSFRSFFAQKG